MPPPGSFAWSGHDRTHSHMIQPDPSGRFVLAADLGLDRILVWKFDAAAGQLCVERSRPHALAHDSARSVGTLRAGRGPRARPDPRLEIRCRRRAALRGAVTTARTRT